MIDEETQSLSRPQRRLLRRVYNGRTEPVIADGRPFLTYRLARDYLETLTPEERAAAYLEMKAQAR